MILLFLVGAICLLAYFLAKTVGTIPSLRTIRMFNKLPGPNLPFFFGSDWAFYRMDSTEVLPHMQKGFEKYGSWYAVYATGHPKILCSDPEFIKEILGSINYIDKGQGYSVLKTWLLDGLLLSTGDKWKVRRKLLTPSFHFKILEDSMECITRNWKNVKDTFIGTKGATIEILPILGTGLLNIICETVMGNSFEENDIKDYAAAVERAAQSFVERKSTILHLNDFLFSLTAKSQAYAKDLKILHGFTRNVVKSRKTVFEQTEQSDHYSGRKPQLFLDSLLEMSKGENLSDIDIQEEVDNFMFAGHDTTSTGMQYIIMRLGENPEVQEKAYQEQIEIFGFSGRDPTKADLSKMHYLDQVIKETLRLHPPVPQIGRELKEDLKLPSGHIVPAGTIVMINIFLTHRNPKYWDEPEAFNPERFSMDSSKDRHPYSYIPFSAGPRNCIGQKFAMMLLKIGVSTILRYCKISTVTRSQDLKQKMRLTLQSNPTIKVQLHHRNQ